MRKNAVTVAIAASVLIVAMVLPQNAQAQIQHVEQTVFGMDCAPCAHALQKRLGGLDGVTDVKVSLDKGLATLNFNAQNQVKLSALRKAVEESGFAAREATVRVAGTLRREKGELFVVSNSGERYLLRPSEKARAKHRRLMDSSDGERVEVTGIIPDAQKRSRQHWELQVLDAQG